MSSIATHYPLWDRLDLYIWQYAILISLQSIFFQLHIFTSYHPLKLVIGHNKS
jgi:hypothetical protein